MGDGITGFDANWFMHSGTMLETPSKTLSHLYLPGDSPTQPLSATLRVYHTPHLNFTHFLRVDSPGGSGDNANTG